MLYSDDKTKRFGVTSKKMNSEKGIVIGLSFFSIAKFPSEMVLLMMHGGDD